MSGGLSLNNNGNLAAFINNFGLSNAVEPLVKEIFLFNTHIAGTTHLSDKSPLEKINKGDKLILRREDNKYDRKAILVLNEQEEKLGYVPEKDNAVFSRLMDAGKCLTARIYEITPSPGFTLIEIGIYLMDF